MERLKDLLVSVKEKGYLRNGDMTLAVIGIVLVLWALPDTPQNVGMLSQLLSFVIGIVAACSLGAYSHRQIFKDMRPHLHVDSFDDLKAASYHRLIWCLTMVVVYVAWWVAA